jgi:hypothetical protein
MCRNWPAQKLLDAVKQKVKLGSAKLRVQCSRDT